MNTRKRLVIARFLRPHDILGAVKATRQQGFTIRDVYTPCLVPGLAEAMGLRRSRLPWICFLLGLAGAAFKVWFEFWTSWISWPINVGGKPWNSLPAFLPVTFEFMVLFAGVSVVFAFLWARKLFPGKGVDPSIERVTDDHFVLIVEQASTDFDIERLKSILLENAAIEITRQRGGRNVE
jgi:hypothetical protein